MRKSLAANALTLIIFGMIALAVVVSWGRSQFYVAGPLVEPLLITVDSGDNLSDITPRLVAGGAIENEQIFRLGARYSGLASQLKFGEYEIPAGASMEGILLLISSGRSIQYKVTIPEGLSSFEVVQVLLEDPILTGEIADIPPEGSLAPDTYLFGRGASRDSIIETMTEAQLDILTAAWIGRMPNLPVNTAEELLILASIIEKETGLAEERRQVASVFINRLERGMRLQTDPSVVYGITLGREKLGRGLRRSELDRETPYNTYLISGLPPTPIANPGRAAIAAAANPDNTPYLFFVADGTGGHAFATTNADHNANVARWRAIENSN
ncbi:MAG: endolytic transglycosylase MltG [Rhodobacteraceae bacterium]|nr:endolytic transglycosylase MltG [Paracoccaceae bacterium]